MLDQSDLQSNFFQSSKRSFRLGQIIDFVNQSFFAADHGIEEEKVSPSPKEVTWQQISNFLHGGAGINFLCRQHGFTLKIVDAGVDYDLPYEKGIINMKVGRGTRNFLQKAAMTPEEMELCLEHGAQCVDTSNQEGCNIISFGEMGIGNTSSSSDFHVNDTFFIR